MTIAEQVAFTRNEMARLAAAMDAAWDAAGTAHAKARISVCRWILESPNAEWMAERDGVIAALQGFTPPPPPPPAPPPSYWDKQFAIVVTATNASADLARQAGVQAIAFDLSIPANLAEKNTSKWAGLIPGGFYVVRTNYDNEAAARAEAQNAAALYGQNNLAFLVVDTEIWKADVVTAGPRLTDAFYANLRSLLGPGVPVANITYGWHQNAAVVPRETFVKHDVEPWWEAYNGDEASWDTRAVCEKLNSQGHRPARLSLGDKRLREQVTVWKQLVREGKAAKGTMLWAIDNGPAVEALAGGVKLT